MEAPQRRERRRLGLGAFGRPRGRDAGSTRDAVTGLMNLPAFTAVAGHVLGRCGQTAEPCGLLHVRLEDQDEGEVTRARRLREAARALVVSTRGEDVLGRTGALELCALLPGVGGDDLEAVAARLDVPGATMLALHVTSEKKADVSGLLASLRKG